MFQCFLDGTGGFSVEIDGCPKNGLAAIDFRRQHGLPDAPSNIIILPSFQWEDEAFVREHAHLADSDADIEGSGRAGKQINLYVGAPGHIHQPKWQEGFRSLGDVHGYVMAGGRVQISPQVIKAYLQARTKETGRAFFLDLWFGERRIRARVMHEAYGLQTEEGRRKALEYLKGDQDALTEACAIIDAESEGVCL